MTAGSIESQEPYLDATLFAICAPQARLLMRPSCPNGFYAGEIDLHKSSGGVGERCRIRFKQQLRWARAYIQTKYLNWEPRIDAKINASTRGCSSWNLSRLLYIVNRCANTQKFPVSALAQRAGPYCPIGSTGPTGYYRSALLVYIVILLFIFEISVDKSEILGIYHRKCHFLPLKRLQVMIIWKFSEWALCPDNSYSRVSPPLSQLIS